MKGKRIVPKRLFAYCGRPMGVKPPNRFAVRTIFQSRRFYRWKKKYGDMELADAKRLKAVEKEIAELKKMLAESMLENRVLKEVNSKKW